MSWTTQPAKEYEDEEKRDCCDIVCDQEVAVVGLTGWSGEARVYDVQTGELKFKLQCNNLGEDEPEPFSHDSIMVWLGTNKDKEKIEELKRVKSMEENLIEEWFEEKTKEIRDVGVKDDMVYAGYDKGFFLISDQDG